jgi:C4-dicarboxylate transporter DctM subunit
MSPLALGIIIVVNTSIGMITPPMAVNLFVAGSIAKVKIEQISRAILPYLFAEILALLIFTYFSQIITFLPWLLGA